MHNTLQKENQDITVSKERLFQSDNTNHARLVLVHEHNFFSSNNEQTDKTHI